MSDDTKTILSVIGIVCIIISIIVYGFWSDSNGIRVSTDEPTEREIKATGQSFNIPIEVRSRIEYKNDYVVSKDTIVEFCDVKETKKQMKEEMKIYWKEMKRGCK